jgi:UPF0755 protein
MRGRHAERGRARALVILVALFALLGVGTGGFYLWATGASGASRPVSLVVPEGATAAEVSHLLVEAGVVRSALAFRLLARLDGATIQAGTYQLQTNLRPREALDVLLGGPVAPEMVTLTVPEGLRLDQVAERVGEVLPVDPAAFAEAAGSGAYTLPPYLPEKAGSVEGFLFPKTYELDPEADADAVIRRLLRQFEEEAGALPWTRAERLGVSPYEVVVVASLIEREARVPEDRRNIASVIYNRLNEGMRLQIDATVQYALPEHKPRLTYQDYEYESPYNTYLHDGLPPTPIASPGLASLEAALRPAKTGFLFYIAVDDEGHHRFTETYEEFLRIKNEVQGE